MGIKRWKYVLLVLCPVVWAGCGGGGSAVPDPQDASIEPDAISRGFPPCDPRADAQKITFVHVNDLHATYTPDGPGQSPAARLRGHFEQVLADQPYTLFTHGGDAYEKGSVAELLTAGRATREIVHAMDFDVAVMGNHDFAWTLQETLAFTRHDYTVMLSSNITFDGTDPASYGAVDFAAFEVGCLRVGFFGMVARGYDEMNEETDQYYYPELPARHDYVDRAEELVAAFGPEVDLMVMVSHLGLNADHMVATWVPGIHVVLGGHSHDELPEVHLIDNGALVVQAGAYACCVSELQVTVRLSDMTVVDHRYSLVPNDPPVMEADPEVQAVVEAVMANDAPDAFAERGWASAPQSEGEVAVVAARAAVFHLGADAAIADSDSVWQSWLPGALTQQDLADTFKVERQPAGTPGFSAFYVVTVSGEDLATAAGGLPSGWVYEGPAAPVPQQTYTLALPRYGAVHPDLYFPAGVGLSGAALGSEIWEAVDAYAVSRTTGCLYLDADTPLPNCP